MNTKNLVALSLLVGIGAVLHAVIPPIFLGMKPDMMVTMMFLGIILFPEIKSVMLISIVTGMISAMTTGFPGGQIPNIIDKPITALIFFAAFLALGKYRNSIISVSVLTAIGVMISGFVFLSAATLVAGFTGPIFALFGTIVLPTAAVSTIAMIILYPVALSVVKRTKLASPTVISK